MEDFFKFVGVDPAKDNYYVDGILRAPNKLLRSAYTSKDIKSVLNELVTLRNLTAEDLSKKAQLDVSVINAALTTGKISLDNLDKLCEVLGLEFVSLPKEVLMYGY